MSLSTKLASSNNLYWPQIAWRRIPLMRGRENACDIWFIFRKLAPLSGSFLSNFSSIFVGAEREGNLIMVDLFFSSKNCAAARHVKRDIRKTW